MAILNFPVSPIDASVIDYKPSSDLAVVKFREWHVESLLNKTADLLDRCLADRAKYDPLRAQGFLSGISMEIEIETMTLEEKRRDAGFLDIPIGDSDIKLSRLQQAKVALDAVATDFKQENSANPSNINGAQINLNENTLSRLAMEIDLAQRADTFLRSPVIGQVEASKLQLLEAKKRLDKKVAATGQNGPLDYATQAKSFQERMDRDFKDAANRIMVASKGLRNIFGYSDLMLKQLEDIEKGSDNALDDAVAWVREAIRWLAAFSQNDQSFTLVISLKKALGLEWPKLFDGTTLQFKIDNSLFDKHRYVRLRGLSASLLSQANVLAYPVQCVVRVPERAKYVAVGKDGTDIHLPDVDQGSKVMPACTLGRVADARLSREPEVCGAISLMNASPIGIAADSGKWSIQTNVEKSLAKNIEDILLEIYVSGQPVLEK